MINYNQFIKQSTQQVKERLAFFDNEKWQGKIYQDKIVLLLQDSHISLSHRSKLTDQKKQQVISDILKDIPLIDNELYGKLVIRRKEYRKKYHPWRTLSLDEYIAQWLIWVDIDDEQTIKEITKEKERSYNSYKDNMDYKYKTWNKEMEAKLSNEKDIIDFIKKRVRENYKQKRRRYEKILAELEEDIDQLKKHKNKNKEELENLQQQLQYEYQEYQDMKLQFKDDNYKKSQRKKFRDKLVKLLHNYITSTEHADENLRKTYIALFLYDELKDRINFDQQKEYNLSLWKHTERYIKQTSDEIGNILVNSSQNKKEKKRPIRNQLSLDFDQKSLSNQQLKLSFG